MLRYLKQISIISVLLFSTATASDNKTIDLQQSDQIEFVREAGQTITYVTGNVIFKTESGFIYCDTARWKKDEYAHLNGKVKIDDKDYLLAADSVFYDLKHSTMLALGKEVTLWSYEDSLYAEGTNAFFDDNYKSFEMRNRPTLYLKYPDTANMVRVIGDDVEYNTETKDAKTFGSVQIISNEFSSISGCALMNTKGDKLELFDKPVVTKDESAISGELISMYFDSNNITNIDVLDSARAEIKETVDSLKKYYDESILSGNRIKINFIQGLMDNVICYGQAYSWFYPSSKGKQETHQNTVSGDTIKLYFENESVRNVDVINGAIGQYISSKVQVEDDTTVIEVVDTIDYNSNFIRYAIVDSLISLKKYSHVKSGPVDLNAHEIQFDTKQNIIEAFSAGVSTDTIVDPYLLSTQVQPNLIPVILKDGDEEIYGDYLLYSIDTDKGRIVQSKTDFNQGYYYGEKLFREQKDIYYVHQGRYTTCDANEPHFHFRSTNMKMIENDKLIARPVVFYIEKLPILALPYYVFPLKKGRRSGLHPDLSFGKFERGERYISNVGYYWAISDYADWMGAFDYHEIQQSITFRSRVDFNIRYLLNGFLTGNYTRKTDYDGNTAIESKRTQWTLNGAYNHDVTPSFSISSTANIVSDATYFEDYSQNYDERTNRNIKSQLSFRKKFGSKTTLTGNFVHDVDLDRETRTDNLPSLQISLPTLFPFGSGSKNEKGQIERKWYHNFSFRYSPSLINFSSRQTPFTLDSTEVIIDTITTYDVDTLKYRSRKKYTKISHNPTLNLPKIELGNYLNIVPSLRYNETWFKIYQTDQSDAAGIEADKFYRTYQYSANVGASTKLYGTLYPNLFGMTAFRHVFSPSANYSYSPDINDYPDERAFVGGGAGSSKRSSVSFSVNNLFQTKIGEEGQEKSYNLLSLTSGFSYNFEAEEKPLSLISTSFQANQLPIISSLSGNMTHDFYDPDTGEENLWSPTMTAFSIRADFRLAGKNFIFDDPQTKTIPQGADSASNIPENQGSGFSAPQQQGWSLYLGYNFSESGFKEYYRKSSYLNLTLKFNLTPTTSVSYTQNYSIHKSLTTHSRINIIKKIHCWTGSIFWVPVGTNRGFGFSLSVTDMPAIKLDNNYDGFTRTVQQF